MLTFLVRRSLLAVLTLFAITVITYAIVQMPPGDYVDAYIQNIERENSEFTMDDFGGLATALRKRWGLDKPLPIQYIKWMSNVDSLVKTRFEEVPAI